MYVLCSVCSSYIHVYLYMYMYMSSVVDLTLYIYFQSTVCVVFQDD